MRSNLQRARRRIPGRGRCLSEKKKGTKAPLSKLAVEGKKKSDSKKKRKHSKEKKISRQPTEESRKSKGMFFWRGRKGLFSSAFSFIRLFQGKEKGERRKGKWGTLKRKKGRSRRRRSFTKKGGERPIITVRCLNPFF